MTKEAFLEQVTQYTGGRDNVGRCEFHGGALLLALKDRSQADLDALGRMEGVAAVELSRTRLKVTVQDNVLEEQKMAKKDYTELSRAIIENVGGKENITAVLHCVTRLRFQLVDMSKANTDAIKKLDGVASVVQAGGQYQVVIGPQVADVYNVVCKQTGLAAKAPVAAEKDDRSVKDKILSFVSAVLAPSAAVLCASGMIKGILALCSTFGWMAKDGGLYILFSAIADAAFYFIPALVAYNTAKVMNMNLILGTTIGLALCYPKINGVELNILGITFNNTYTSTILPAVFTVILAAFLERFFNKVLPDMIKNFFTPMLVLLISLPLGYAIIGPIANTAASTICGVLLGINSFSPILAALAIGAFYQVMVVFGIHGVFIVTVYMNILNGIPDPNYAALGVCSFAQTGVVLAIWFKTHDKKLKDIALPAAISGVFGVTEPAIYGVTLPRIKHFIVSCVASAIAAVVGAIMGLNVYTIPGMGIFKIPGYINPENPAGSLVVAVIVMALAVVLGFIGSFILYKDEEYANL